MVSEHPQEEERALPDLGWLNLYVLSPLSKLHRDQGSVQECRRRFLDSCLSCPRQPQQCASGDWEEAVPGEKSVPVTRPGPSPHQQAIITAMPGGLPGPKTPNIQQCPAHGMKCRRKGVGGQPALPLPGSFSVASRRGGKLPGTEGSSTAAG